MSATTLLESKKSDAFSYQPLPITELRSHDELKYGDSFSKFILEKENLEEKVILEYFHSCKFDFLGVAISFDKIAMFLDLFPKILPSAISENFYPIKGEQLRVQLNQIIKDREQIKDVLLKSKEENSGSSFLKGKESPVILEEKEIFAYKAFLDRNCQFMEIIVDILLILKIPQLISSHDKSRVVEEVSRLLENEQVAHYVTNKALILFIYWEKFPMELFFNNEKIRPLLNKLDSHDIMLVGKILQKKPDLLKKFIIASDAQEKLESADYQALVSMTEKGEIRLQGAKLPLYS